VSVRDVLAGSEVSGGEGWVLYGLQDLLYLGVGDVHQGKGWSMAGDERRHACASRECGDAFLVPNLVRDGVEGGRQQ
jgi:hypothetical protein